MSTIGPPTWKDVDPSLVEEWSDFTLFMNASSHDLKIDDNYCNDPRRPSPVNLVPTMPCDDSHEILTKMIRMDDCTFNDMTFEIAPNMLRAFMPYVNTTCRLPTMNLSGELPNDWTFIWLEVHLRSEHVIDGRRFDGEIQLIHLGNNAQNRELAAPTILLHPPLLMSRSFRGSLTGGKRSMMRLGKDASGIKGCQKICKMTLLPRTTMIVVEIRSFPYLTNTRRLL
jgi:hypothetical protein